MVIIAGVPIFRIFTVVPPSCTATSVLFVAFELYILHFDGRLSHISVSSKYLCRVTTNERNITKKVYQKYFVYVC